MASLQYSVKSNKELRGELNDLRKEMKVIEKDTQEVKKNLADIDRKSVNRVSASENELRSRSGSYNS